MGQNKAIAQLVEALAKGSTANVQKVAKTAAKTLTKTEVLKALDDFVAAEQIKDFNTTKLTIKGKEVDVALSPYTAEELMPRIEKLIILRQLADPDVAQPRRGWQKIFGNVIGEDGWPIDFGGGRGETATKKGSSKPLYVRSTKNANERHFRETLFPVDQRNLAERRKFKDVPEKHHVNHLIGTLPFGMMKDASGKVVKRSTEQLERIAKVMQNRYGIYVGDQDWNEVMLSRPAHTGLKSDPDSLQFSAHGQIQGATDAQGAPIVKGKRSEVFEGGQTLDKTYEAGQGHGFSNEFLDQLYGLKSDEEVVRAMKIYYDIHSEPLKGSAALARRVIDEPRGKVQDPMSAEIQAKNLPEETTWTQGVEKLPQYQNEAAQENIVRAKARQLEEGVIRDRTLPVDPIEKRKDRSLFAVDGNSR